ncbi:MAG: hypothetical protein NC421_04305 [Lachnospiraceae bacterium]|nr:hypothetical protein [Lachnospiraceae bacterium]
MKMKFTIINNLNNMKNLVLLFTVFCACLSVSAQESTTDYIYSSDGFEVKEMSAKGGYGGTGLYSKDGKVLVSCIGSNGSSNFYVLDGCEVICSRAFQGVNGAKIYIPSSVKYIAPDALLSNYNSANGGRPINRFVGIHDGCKEANASSAAYTSIADPNATEVARYDINGVRLDEPTTGINIVQMSDGTSEKVLVK